MFTGLSQCTVTETDNGGADSSTGPVNVDIVRPITYDATIVNTFAATPTTPTSATPTTAAPAAAAAVTATPAFTG